MTALLRHLLPLILALTLPLQALSQTMVRLHTTQGPIDFRLLDAEAPRTVANFLAYMRAGDYNGVLFHRSVPGFIVQGGGFRWPEGTSAPAALTTRPAVANEFSANRSNVRGTVAMAKLGNNPDSATSQWFVNLANNAANLDTQNGGFTVFARVTAPGMVVADRIAALPRINAGGVVSAFNEQPVTSSQGITLENWRSRSIFITAVTEFPAQQSDVDRVFNYLEAAYPEFLSPSQGEAGQALGYDFRYYAGSNAYVGVQNGQFYYLVPAINDQINHLASVADLLVLAQQAGY